MPRVPVSWLLPEPQHARRRWVLCLEPGLAGTGPIRMLAVLRDDAFGAEPAGMREDGRAVALNVLAILDSRRRLREELCQLGLALLELPRAPVLAIELQKVERVEDHLIVIRAAMQLVEDREAIAVAPHRFPVDHRRGHSERRHARADERISVGPVIAAPREKTYPV